MAKQAKKAARAPTSDPNILIVAQAGRLTYEAVLFVASLRAHAPGFAGLSVALGDIDDDGSVDIIASDGNGFIVMVDKDGEVQRISSKELSEATNAYSA